MYDEYPDLIYEGLIRDLFDNEIVTENSNKKGIIQRLKELILRLIQRIKNFFKKTQDKKAQSGDNKSSIGKKVKVGDFNLNKAKEIIDKFPSAYTDLSSEFIKLGEELKSKYSELSNKKDSLSEGVMKELENQMQTKISSFNEKCDSFTKLAQEVLNSDEEVEIEITKEIYEEANSLMNEIKSKNIVALLEKAKNDLEKISKICFDIEALKNENKNIGEYAQFYRLDITSIQSYYRGFLGMFSVALGTHIIGYCNTILNV